MELHNTGPQESQFQIFGPEVVSLLTSELELAPDDPNRKTTLYTHQMEAALQTKAWFVQPPRPAVIVAPTGSGKTAIVTLLPYVLGSPNVIILSPAPIILDQLLTAFDKYNPVTFFANSNILQTEGMEDFTQENVHVIRSMEHMDRIATARLVIINVREVSGNSMTLTNRVEIGNVSHTFASFATIIVDEAHHFPADTWAAIIQIFHRKQVIFLTALRHENLIPGLPQQNTYQIHLGDINGVRIRDIEYVEIEEIDKDKIVDFDDDDINTLRQRILGYLDAHDLQLPEVRHKAMVLVWGKESARNLAERLEGVATFHTSDDIGDANLKMFEGNENEECKILVVCKKLIADYANSDVSVCVILRKVQAPMLIPEFIRQCQHLSISGDPVKAVVLSFPGF